MRLFALLLLGLLLGACAGVLGLRRGSSSHPFEHRAHVLKGVSCLTCHKGLTDERAPGPLHLPTTADCKGCHTTPHDQRDCRGCHGEADAREGAELAHQHLRFGHAAHLPEVKGDCVRCHQEIASARPGALRPAMATCFSCHRHEREWATRDCEGCHVDLPGEHVLPASHLVHDGDWLREHGVRAASARDLCATCHSERTCASCHGVTVPALPWKLAFDETPLSGLHRAGFKSRHAEEAHAQPGLCTTCHTEQSCVTCHETARVAPGVAPRSPHPPGWMSPGRGGGEHGVQARLDPMACAACHGGAGEQLCVGCHKVGGPGGNPHGPGFSSTKNKRAALPCRLCHGAGP